MRVDLHFKYSCVCLLAFSSDNKNDRCLMLKAVSYDNKLKASSFMYYFIAVAVT